MTFLTEDCEGEFLVNASHRMEVICLDGSRETAGLEMSLIQLTAHVDSRGWRDTRFPSSRTTKLKKDDVQLDPLCPHPPPLHFVCPQHNRKFEQLPVK